MPPARQPIADRLVARLSEDEAGCWIWTGSKRNRTYGSIGRGGRGGGSVYTHRLAYELWVGPVPAGADIDHLCRVPACCNPDHLEAVSRSVNLRRGIRRGATPGHRVTDEGRANMRLAAQRRVLTPAGRAQILAAGFRDRVPTSAEIGGRP